MNKCGNNHELVEYVVKDCPVCEGNIRYALLQDSYREAIDDLFEVEEIKDRLVKRIKRYEEVFINEGKELI